MRIRATVILDIYDLMPIQYYRHFPFVSDAAEWNKM